MADDTLVSPVLLRAPMIDRQSLLITSPWAQWMNALWLRSGGALAPSNAGLSDDLDGITEDLSGISDFAWTLLDDTTEGAMQSTLGLVPGVTIQAFDTTLSALAGLTTSADTLPYFTGADVAALTPLTAFARTLLDDADQATMQTTLAITPAGTAQPLDATLTALASLVTSADTAPYFTGVDTAGLTALTPFARTYLDDTTQAATRTTLGVGTGDSPDFAGLSVDSPTFVVDAVNNRVGIGTATPQGLLDVTSRAFAYALTLTRPTGATISLNLSSVAATDNKQMIWQIGASNRWLWQVSGAEPGANVGSDMILARYSDTGVFLANQLYLQRSSGAIGVGVAVAPDASALLDLTSTTRGLLPPRMTTTQRDAIAAPVNGLVLYNSTTSKLQVRAAGAWVDLH